MSLSDASTLIATNVKFPTTAHIAVEKLYAWSVTLDIFHGVGHGVSVNARDFVISVGSSLYSIEATNKDRPNVAIDLINRVLYEAQQDYFAWATARMGNGPAPQLPTFSHILKQVTSFRVEALSPLPSSWYLKLEVPNPASRRAGQERGGPANAGGAQGARAGVTPTFNSRADRVLARRFRESDFTTLSAMMDGKEVEIPKHNGKDVCLAWAIKGECSAGCRRAEQHVNYSRATLQKIGQLMTACGVPDPQA